MPSPFIAQSVLSDGEPSLPPEIEQEIFGWTAIHYPSSIPTLMRVARRVQLWGVCNVVEPYLFRVIMPPPGPPFSIIENAVLRPTPQSKPASFYRDAVRYVHFVYQSETSLPALTHLCLNNSVPDQILHALLSDCPHLHLLVTLWYFLIARTAPRDPPVSDPRFVVGSYKDFEDEWTAGAHGAPDFWTLAEEFVARKRSGAIPGVYCNPIPPRSYVHLNARMQSLATGWATRRSFAIPPQRPEPSAPPQAEAIFATSAERAHITERHVMLSCTEFYLVLCSDGPTTLILNLRRDFLPPCFACN
ncbi:hypothetical protein B0H11DRAFT_2071639 [Mycena galericulata]|nr:hypothetical protein B0H11DRAFT_2071639 [Mycena galericulata]